MRGVTLGVVVVVVLLARSGPVTAQEGQWPRGHYYTLLDRGFLLNYDARTGREIYGRTRIKPGSGFTASPWAYNDRVFLLGEDGDTFVVRAGPEFKLLHTNSLNEMALATPAVVRGSLILRTQSKLYRISNEAGR